MKLKVVITIAALYASFTIQCGENAIIIRPATNHDLDAILQFNKNVFSRDFKPIVAKTITTEQKLDSFMNKLIIKHQGYCQDFITKQLNQEEYCIVSAHRAPIKQPEQLIGYCRFYKKNDHAIQIGFLGIDELYRRHGIATQLVFAAINKFNGISECNFRTLSNYNFINELYSKLGCIKTGNVYLNPDTLEFSTDSADPTLIPFTDYSYTIKK